MNDHGLDVITHGSKMKILNYPNNGIILCLFGCPAWLHEAHFQGVFEVKRVCPECNGVDSRKRCPTCQGRGRIKCDLCNGEGKWRPRLRGFRGRMTCPKCGGKGSLTCPDCGGTGELVCKTCGGTGTITESGVCPECNGLKIVTCPGCNGTGERPRPEPVWPIRAGRTGSTSVTTLTETP